ncbi:hypothetical protein D3C84_1075890 [compost metagenome]
MLIGEVNIHAALRRRLHNEALEISRTVNSQRATKPLRGQLQRNPNARFGNAASAHSN